MGFTAGKREMAEMLIGFGTGVPAIAMLLLEAPGQTFLFIRSPGKYTMGMFSFSGSTVSFCDDVNGGSYFLSKRRPAV